MVEDVQCDVGQNADSNRRGNKRKGEGGVRSAEKRVKRNNAKRKYDYTSNYVAKTARTQSLKWTNVAWQRYLSTQDQCERGEGGGVT